MKSVRMLAAGAVVCFALAFATAPVRACDDRFIKKCEAEAEAAFVPEPQAAGPVARRTGSRVRTAAPAEKPEVRRMRAPRFTVRTKPAPLPVPPAPTPTLASDMERPVTLESPMSRRFRGFIDPQPMTLNSFEALRRPRLEAEHLAPATTLPGNDINAVAPADEASPAAEAPTAIVTMKVAPMQPAAEPVQHLAEAAPVASPAAMRAPVLASTAQPPGNDQPSGFPLHQLVLTLCGALGVASALRFIVRA
jgi:hypothetical protein